MELVHVLNQVASYVEVAVDMQVSSELSYLSYLTSLSIVVQKSMLTFYGVIGDQLLEHGMGLLAFFLHSSHTCLFVHTISNITRQFGHQIYTVLIADGTNKVNH